MVDLLEIERQKGINSEQLIQAANQPISKAREIGFMRSNFDNN